MASPKPLSEHSLNYSSLGPMKGRNFPSLFDETASQSTVAERVRRYSVASSVSAFSEKSRRSTSSSYPGLHRGKSFDKSLIIGEGTERQNEQIEHHVKFADESSNNCSQDDAVVTVASEPKRASTEPSIVVPSTENPATPEKIQFVQLCFYARLGFVQPACCMKCLYNEAISGVPKSSDCHEWTIWRKDATIPLHPDHLKGNLIMVRCGTAQKLANQETVEGWNWDATSKQLQNQQFN